MEIISQYQYPLIGLGILVIMGLIGYMADQKETGKIAESKKLRKAKLEEKKKLKEQQKAEKMKLQEEKRAEKAKQKEEKAQAKEKAEKNEAKKVEEPVIVPVEDKAESIEMSAENTDELVEEETTEVEENADVFIIEEPTPTIAENLVEEDIQNEVQQTEPVVFEPAIQTEEVNDSVITESGEDLSVPFAFSTDKVAEEVPQQDVLKSESSVAFSSLLEEVQAEEASLNSSDEDDFLKSINMVNSNNSVSGMAAEEDDALKVFMQPNVSNNEKDDMTSDNLDAWKL